MAVAKADPHCLRVYIDLSVLQQSSRNPRTMPSSVASSTTPAKTREPLKRKTVESPHFESTLKRTSTALREEFRCKPPAR
jgi:hypothetical protein